jgi:transketolase
MALAEKVLAAQFNRPGYSIVDHQTYTFLGDGCLMEGISHEVCSLAGTLGLGKLIAFYDDNGISIDGEVEGWFSDDTPARFEAYGWHVIPKIDGHDSKAIKAAIQAAKDEPNKPTLICCKTIIGFGSPNKQGKEDCHGAALGNDEVALTRESLGWHHAPFEIPGDIANQWDAKAKGHEAQSQWANSFAEYQVTFPDLAREFERRMSGRLPDNFESMADAYIAECQEQMEKVASRKASQNCLNAYGPLLPELLGGSADLAGSNLTIWSGSRDISNDNCDGNYIYYGVREFGMSAMMNGIALHGGFINYGATFLMFMEYARNAVRMAAIMKQQSIFVYTHDSIGLGEDGPTHQPVEQLSALRSTPNLNTWRPCDTVESAVAWKSAIQYQTGPSALVFSRQGLAAMPRTQQQVSDIARGGYVLKDFENPVAIIIATGSEMELAMSAADVLADQNIGVRVVSMPCAEVFSKQSAKYQESVLPSGVRARIAVEALHADYWHKFVGLDGLVVGMHTFGESAPGGELMKEFGFTVDNVVNSVKRVIG